MPPFADISKRRIIDEIIARLSRELEAMSSAARAAHEAVTHEESKAEDAHDTRGLEASYLAGAQAQRASELAQQISYYRSLDARELAPGEPAAAGALVELGAGGRRLVYFLVAQGGGLTLQLDGERIQVITPRAPLGEALVGRSAGETIEVETQGQTREYELTGLR